jgi:hypothetical protein
MNEIDERARKLRRRAAEVQAKADAYRRRQPRLDELNALLPEPGWTPAQEAEWRRVRWEQQHARETEPSPWWAVWGGSAVPLLLAGGVFGEASPPVAVVLPLLAAVAAVAGGVGYLIEGRRRGP